VSHNLQLSSQDGVN